MSEPTGSNTRRRAPASHYALAAAFGAVVTIAVSLAVAASNPDDFWLAAGIGALTTAYPATSFGVRMFVSKHTVTRDSRGEESVEVAWLRQATAGAFLDVLVTTIVVSAVLIFSQADVAALPVVVALMGLSAVDAGLRYLAIRYRAMR